MSNILTKSFINPIIFNPVDRNIYVDNGKALNDDNKYWETQPRILNSREYSLAASAKSEDPLKLTDVFINNGTEETNFADKSNQFLTELESVKKQGDRSKAAAIITSKEYTVLQDAVQLGINEEIIKTGILTQIFEEVATPLLSGTYLTWANDLVYFTNLPESKSPEPTFGTASEISITVPKHGGAVAITDRARQVINGGDPFGRLVGQLQQKRILSESIIVRNAIEAIAATNDQAGVDFGARTSMLSTGNPIETLIKLIDFFDTKNAVWNTFVSNALPYIEYVNNDIIRGSTVSNTGIVSVGSNINESSGPMVGATGVTWFRDNLMTTLTEGYAMDRNVAGKNFRGPTRAYTVTDPDTETEKYVTKSHFESLIVDGTTICRVTGIQA